MDFRAFSDEIPPCSFETARRLLWRNTNNELLPVYDCQLCECYLQPQILRCECLGDNKWFFNQKPLIITQAFTTSITKIWVKPSGIPQIWVNPELRESRSDHPELSASPIFEGGHLPVSFVELMFSSSSAVKYETVVWRNHHHYKPMTHQPKIEYVDIHHVLRIVTWYMFHSKSWWCLNCVVAQRRSTGEWNHYRIGYCVPQHWFKLESPLQRPRSKYSQLISIKHHICKIPVNHVLDNGA